MNQIETTRRAMYQRLKVLSLGTFTPLPIQELEATMEEHLEALRQEMEGLKSDVRTAESAHGQSQKVVRVLKAQVSTLLGELDEARADRSKYRQWMRSAVRQNRSERQNVKAYRETQDELVAQIARLQRELAGRMAPERSVDVFASGSTFIQGQSIGCHPIPAYSAPQEPKQ